VEEQRKFSRIKFNADAFLDFAGEHWQVELLDLSLHGVLLQSAYRETLSVGGDVTVFVALGESDNIVFHGKVAHLHVDHIGVVCEHMDVDSISQLRRVVELNLGDDALLQREIAALVESVAAPLE